MTQLTDSAKDQKHTRQILRHQLLDERNQIDAQQRLAWDKNIGEQLLLWLNDRAKKNAVIAVYSAIRSEPNLQAYYEQMNNLGWQLALPIVIDKNQPLLFAKWTPQDEMQKDPYGILIPKQITETKPDIVIIPCVGFNPNRFRLGYGGGFYDRTLAIEPRPITIGIAYQQALVHFKEQAHDIPLDYMLTEI